MSASTHQLKLEKAKFTKHWIRRYVRLSKQHKIKWLQQGILQLIIGFSAFQEFSAAVHGVLRTCLQSLAEEQAKPGRQVGVEDGGAKQTDKTQPGQQLSVWPCLVMVFWGHWIGRVTGGWCYLNSWLNCAFPSQSPPPSWWLSHLDVGQYSEKISKAGFLLPAPWVSGEEGAHLLQSLKLKSLDGKSTNQSISA